ncbi:MAG: DNA-directed RNA polymerase subunit beta, partial [Holosporaceae bacterium]|nr:DNA-directed RNA polymerase subunit beta [Holosporaceae bacterium]
MARTFTERKRFRKSFGRLREVAALPNLIELQRASYDGFLHSGSVENLRDDIGLREAFCSAFPIKDASGRQQVDFCNYHFDELKYSEDECRNRGLTYAAPLRATFRLTVWEQEENGERSIKDIKEQDVYICDLPIMTRDGTFIVNGIERVVVSQMQRSPGVFFDHDNGKTNTAGKYLFAAHIIPYKGAWLDFEFDAKDLIYVRIDRKRKILVSTLLMALDSAYTEAERAKNPEKVFKSSEVYGMDREEILSYFYDSYEIERAKGGLLSRKYEPDQWSGVRLERDLIDAKTGKVVQGVGEKITSRIAKKMKDEGLENIVVFIEDLIGKYNALDVIDPDSGIVIAEAGDELSENLVAKIVEKGTKFSVLCINHTEIGGYIRNTLVADKCTNREEALFELFRIMRPGEPPTIDNAQDMFYNMFFNPDRYDLSAVGRVKMNGRIGVNRPENLGILTKDDILRILKILHQLKDGVGVVDDIDNLANRRVRSVGELMENQFRIGLARMERAVRERMGSVDIENAVPNDVINAKPVSSAIREFFLLSQLSQFMDQTNPLAEITHKRRISALGPGGLTRDRAGLDVRDVHTTHYGRICPIETPEGQNIGLINSLSIFAKINRYGFIETPYRRVVKGKVEDDVEYLSAMEEGKYTIAQANAALTDDGYLVDEFIPCRRNGDFVNAPRESIDFMDVSPKQIISIAAALIPFLENDDASRALMGANMQRQAVPLLKAEAPLVGTGMEAVVANDSGVAVSARHDGVVDQVDANRIVVRAIGDDSSVGVDIYNLRKFKRSNHSTCLNQT